MTAIDNSPRRFGFKLTPKSTDTFLKITWKGKAKEVWPHPLRRHMMNMTAKLDRKLRRHALGKNPPIQDLATYYRIPYLWTSEDLAGDGYSIVDCVSIWNHEGRRLNVQNLYDMTYMGEEDISAWLLPYGRLGGYSYQYEGKEWNHAESWQEMRAVLRQFNPPTSNISLSASYYKEWDDGSTPKTPWLFFPVFDTQSDAQLMANLGTPAELFKTLTLSHGHMEELTYSGFMFLSDDVDWFALAEADPEAITLATCEYLIGNAPCDVGAPSLEQIKTVWENSRADGINVVANVRVTPIWRPLDPELDNSSTRIEFHGLYFMNLTEDQRDAVQEELGVAPIPKGRSGYVELGLASIPRWRDTRLVTAWDWSLDIAMREIWDDDDQALEPVDENN